MGLTFEVTIGPIVNVAGHSYGRVLFGHTFVTKNPDSKEKVIMCDADSGCSFSGHGGDVAASHCTLDGVEWSTSDRLIHRK